MNITVPAKLNEKPALYLRTLLLTADHPNGKRVASISADVSGRALIVEADGKQVVIDTADIIQESLAMIRAEPSRRPRTKSESVK